MADKWTEKEFDAEIEEESLELAEGEEPEMFEHFRLNVDVGQTPIRIDKYMAEHMEDTSRHRVQLAIREGYVHVGDTRESQLHSPSGRCNPLHNALPPQRFGNTPSGYTSGHSLRG